MVRERMLDIIARELGSTRPSARKNLLDRPTSRRRWSPARTSAHDAAPDDGPGAGDRRLRELPRAAPAPASRAASRRWHCQLDGVRPRPEELIPVARHARGSARAVQVRTGARRPRDRVTAQAPHGQGHETTLAQVWLDEMGVPFDAVTVVYGDTRHSPFSLIGTGGSRSSTSRRRTSLTTRKVKTRCCASPRACSKRPLRTWTSRRLVSRQRRGGAVTTVRASGDDRLHGAAHASAEATRWASKKRHARWRR